MGGRFVRARPVAGRIGHAAVSIAELTPNWAGSDRTCLGDTLDPYRIIACDGSVNCPGAHPLWVFSVHSHHRKQALHSGAGLVAVADLVTKLEGNT
jgi:hypothetical protein